MLTTSLTTETQQHLTITPKTSLNNDTIVDGVPVWTVDNTNVVLVPDANGLGGFIKGGKAGVSIVTIKADADMTAAQRFISETIQVTVTQAEATRLEIVIDPPMTQ